MTDNEDFLFAQEALAQGFVTEAQVEEGFLLQKRMQDDLQLDERLAVILVKRGYLAEDQARRVQARIQPKTGPGEIQGYRLLEIVGRGAMGTVYRALHLGLNREVAVKVLRPDLAGDRTQVERLKAEAGMLASLDHPNIVRALDAGESNGFPYVVMEFVEGESLRDRLRREGPLPEPEALRITRSLADALERARRMGVVHRDVKPGNVLLTRAGVPKLMDLGLAKGPIDLGLTQHGATVGTPQYIAPEQALDPRKADTRSDIYSLGATLYAMLTGRPPFDGTTLAEVLTKVLYEVPAPVRSLRPEISAETGYLVERMMLRDPGLRYRTPALLVADIDRLTQGTTILPAGFRGNWEAWLLRRRIRHTTVLAAASVLSALLIAGGVRAVQEWRRREKASDAVAVGLASLRTEVSPLETRTDLAGRLERAEELLARTRAVGSPREADLSAHVRDLKEHLRRLDLLEATIKAEVDPALARGDFAAAHAALHDYGREFPVWGPARLVQERRSREVAEASDEALRVERRERAFPAAPSDVAEVASAAARWRDRLTAVFVPSALQRDEHGHALDAAEASRRIATAVETGLARLDEAWLESAVDDLHLAGARRDVAAASEAAESVLRAEGDALTAPDRRFLSAERLADLVREPFQSRREALDERVAAAWRDAEAEAARLAGDGDTVGALDLLNRWAGAAGESDAYPTVALAAGSAHADLGSRTKEKEDLARAALRTLVAEAVAVLRRGDLDAVERLAASARPRVVGSAPAQQGLEEVAAAAPALRSVRVRALAGLSARAGKDKSKWMESLRFRDLPQPEPLVEVVDVRADGTFTYRTHRGNSVQGPFTRSVDDVVEEDRLRLAGESGATLARAVAGLASLPLDSPDFYVAIPALRDVEERFEAVRPGSAFAAWALAERQRVEREAQRNETSAEARLVAGREASVAGRHSEAYHWFRSLVDPSEEPTLRLPVTKVAKQWAAYVEGQMERIRTEFKVDELELLWPGLRVARRAGAPSGVLDVDLTIDFDRPVQKELFLSGWGRFVPAAQGRAVLTPQAEATGLSFRMNADGEGEVVRDRPLVLECPFDATAEMSMSFWIWPETPIFLGLELDGVQAGILSADPRTYPFPPDVPMISGERQPPAFDIYGRGRGVVLRAAPAWIDPERWGWEGGNHGRHFVPPDIDRSRRREQLDRRWFAFETRERPYHVKLVRVPDKGVRLEIDDREVASESTAAFRSPRPSGRIRLLTFTPCVIDDLVLSGRIDAEWFEKMKAKRAYRGPTTDGG